MKKFLYSVLALGAAATLASCSSEEPLGPNDRPNDGKVTFNLCLEGAQTRAFGETTDCNEIIYTVFDMNDQVVLEDKTETAFGTGVNTATVELQLVANQQYKVIFYAHNNNSNFSSYANGVVTVNYGSENIHVNSNVDDAFINKQTYTPAGATEALPNQVFTADGNAKTVYLTRPFAQVNFGTNDLNNTAVQNILDNVSTEFTVSSGLYSTYSVLDEEATTEYTGAYTATTGKPQENTDFPVGGYSNLLSAYLLVDQAQSVINANYTIKLAGKPNINTLNLSAMPVQGNYRTNVYGSLLTTQNDFNVTIVPGFDDEINQVIPGKGEILMNGQKYDSIKDAITAAAATESKSAEIALGAGNWNASEISSATNRLTNLSITGIGDASVIEMTSANTVANTNLVFKRIKLITPNTGYIGFQHIASASYEDCTIQNVLFLYGGTETFTRCKFINNDEYNVWTYGASNATFKDCTFGEYGKGILIYIEGGKNTNTNVIGCTFNGTSVVGKAAIEIDGTFPSGGEGLHTVNIDNCTVNGYAPGSVSGSNIWNVKKGENAKVTLNGTVVFPQP